MQEMGLPTEMRDYFVEKSIELSAKDFAFDGVRGLLETLRINNCYIGLATGKDECQDTFNFAR